MEPIKSCPLCGGPGKLKDSQGRQVRQGWVGCPACGLYISWKISPDGAVAKWNRRARASESLPEALTPDAVGLIYSMPHAVNMLAGRLAESMEKWILYGNVAGGPSPSPAGEAEAAP